jgi:sodium-dependent dicarboxylate transporter 2/3/5
MLQSGPIMTERSPHLRSSVQWVGLAAGPILALFAYILLPGSYRIGGGDLVAFSHAGRATAAAAVWMATWWMTEAIPVYATSLLPLALLPLAGAATIRAAASPYGHELIFLFMGGFIIALAMQRWDLHRRIAFKALRLVGTRPAHIVGVFMVVTAFLSMWVSNTAVTVMMLPIAVSVIDLVGRERPDGSSSGPDHIPPEAGRNFSLCLLLGIAYAASIGGIGTLIGTPPNLFLASFVKEQLGRDISFVRWMGVGLPLVAIFLPITWLVLTRSQYPIRIRDIEGSAELVRRAHDSLGPMKRGEWATLIVFVSTAMLWLLRPLLSRIAIAGVRPLEGLTDPGIAMLGALALFLIPVDIGKRVFAMDWNTAVRLPWGLLILFGGGLSLAAAIGANGVSEFLGNQVGALAGLPPLVLVIVVTALMIYLTEMTSNTATTAALVPILAALAPGLGLNPYMLIVPAAVAASCAFMLPVATPPNAIVFGTGLVTIPQMCRAGWWLNLIGIVLITLLTYAVAMPLLAF